MTEILRPPPLESTWSFALEPQTASRDAYAHISIRKHPEAIEKQALSERRLVWRRRARPDDNRGAINQKKLLNFFARPLPNISQVLE